MKNRKANFILAGAVFVLAVIVSLFDQQCGASLACVTVLPIATACGSKPGGLVTVWIALESDVASFGTLTKSGTALNVASVTMVATKFPAKWDFEEKEAASLISSKADGSDAFEQVLSFAQKGNRQDIVAQLTSMIGGRYIVWAKDSSGQLRMMCYFPNATPTEFKGAELGQLEDTTGENFDAKPLTKWQFKRKATHPAVYFTGTIPTA